MGKTRTNQEIIKQVNEYGLGKYTCVNPRCGRDKRGVNLVSIKCIKTNKIKKNVNESDLRKGNNPFNTKFNRKPDSYFENQVNKLGKLNKKAKYFC